MKVLELVDTLSAGGAERLLGTMARFGSEAGIDVGVAALNAGNQVRREMAPLLRDAGVQPTTIGFKRLADPAAFARLVNHIRAQGFDVVHAHLEYAAIVGAVAAGLCRRPLVVTLHHVSAPDNWKSATIERLAVESAGRRASSLVYVSEASRSSFAARYRQRANWTVVPNGIELPRSGTVPSQPDLELPPGPRAVLVGNMRPGKGHAEAIDAWPEICARVPGAVLVLVGGGELEGELRRRASDRGVAAQFVFIAFRTDAQTFMATADVVLLPSHQEALPTVLMEAAALGKPVVATRVGGVAEVVDDGVTGTLVPPGNRAALVEAVATLFTDGPRRAYLGAAARRRAEVCFDARVWLGQLGALYERALTEGRAPTRRLRTRTQSGQ